MKLLKASMILAIVTIACLMACKKSSDNSPSNPGSTDTKDSVMYDSEFDGPDKAWGTGDDSYSTRTIANGYYTILNKDPDNFYYNTTGVKFYGLKDKLAMEAKLKVAGGNENYPAFGGITWNYRINGKQLGVFGYYNDGTFEIFAFNDAGEFSDIKAVTASSAIKKNDFNLLRIEQRSGVFYYFINGTEVYHKIIDTTATNVPGKETLDLPGFQADPSTTTTVDYYKTYKLK